MLIMCWNFLFLCPVNRQCFYGDKKSKLLVTIAIVHMIKQHDSGLVIG